MNIKQKQELVNLLSLYSNELFKDNEDNIQKKFANQCIAQKVDDGSYDSKIDGKYNYYTSGVKERYRQARIIISKLMIEIENELKTTDDLHYS